MRRSARSWRRWRPLCLPSCTSRAAARPAACPTWAACPAAAPPPALLLRRWTVSIFLPPLLKFLVADGVGQAWPAVRCLAAWRCCARLAASLPQHPLISPSLPPFPLLQKCASSSCGHAAGPCCCDALRQGPRRWRRAMHRELTLAGTAAAATFRTDACLPRTANELPPMLHTMSPASRIVCVPCSRFEPRLACFTALPRYMPPPRSADFIHTPVGPQPAACHGRAVIQNDTRGGRQKQKGRV